MSHLQLCNYKSWPQNFFHQLSTKLWNRDNTNMIQ